MTEGGIAGRRPVIVGGKLYIRNQNELTSYDVKGK